MIRTSMLGSQLVTFVLLARNLGEVQSGHHNPDRDDAMRAGGP